MFSIEFKEFQYEKKYVFINVMINAIIFDTIRPESRNKCARNYSEYRWREREREREILHLCFILNTVARSIHSTTEHYCPMWTTLTLTTSRSAACNADVSCIKIQIIPILENYFSCRDSLVLRSPRCFRRFFSLSFRYSVYS